MHACTHARQAILTSELKLRPVAAQQPGDANAAWTTVRIAAAVEELVQTEKTVLAAKEVYKHMDSVLRVDADVLVNKMVRHFMTLFDIRRHGESKTHLHVCAQME